MDNGYAFVEYNTTSGRKRGYVRYSDLSNYYVRSYNKNITHQSLKKATKELTVYGGPNSDYASIGTIFNQEVVSFIDTERNYSYIEYTTSNGAKRGYVQTASLTTASAPSIPSIPTYTNFTSGTYGKSGLGKDLKWYKIGSGSNVVFAVFEQHAGKLTNGLVNMITSISGGSSTLEGGTVVNELCQIKTTSSVNVRSGPGTSYSIVTSLTNGTKVTRIKKAVATANGYTWDKIQLSDGKIGYVATNYLILVTDDYGYSYGKYYDEIAAIKAYYKYETGHYTDTIDKQYNNELVTAVEEYQKAYNLSVKDGSINNETLTHMGFSVDSNNKIVNNAFYKKYIRIADIYNDKELSKIHIYDAEFEDGSSEPRYITFGKNSSVTDSHYNDTKNTENSYYGTYYDLEENKNKRPSDEKLLKTEADIDILIEDFADKYPRSALAFQQYRNNNGNLLSFGEIKSIFDLTNQKSLRDSQLQRCMDASQSYVNKDLTSVKMAFENYYTTTIWKLGSSIQSNTQLDWYAAANSVSMGVKATTTKSGNQYTMTTTFTLRDYYDWGNNVFFFPNSEVFYMKEKDLKDLHYCGRAKNFESTGNDYVVKTVWNEGQAVDQATITLVSY